MSTPGHDTSQFFDSEGVRVCPHEATEVGCWWVRSGHPHTAAGYGCCCLVPHSIWTKGPEQ